jgi:hypothetical protein
MLRSQYLTLFNTVQGPCEPLSREAELSWQNVYSETESRARLSLEYRTPITGYVATFQGRHVLTSRVRDIFDDVTRQNSERK